ncbi:UNKNOWN [Stylonychia lemnae]|uniref:Right handed beta helix domain-containing protein n=1 Tax=Stylonychia lemnae TaxID=5949 RepID=A0A078A6N6_STYLE|nr:UNKNOWN [Stylonychia lemnae]|eukprot:CDW77910.1 UNKNOWN [Stylonychia lemnae]
MNWLSSKEQNGGGIFVDAINSMIEINESQIINASANINGGFINMNLGSSINIFSTNITFIRAFNKGSLIYTNQVIESIYLNENQIQCEQPDTEYDDDTNLQKSIYKYGGTIYAMNSNFICSRLNTYQNCHNRNQGGMFYLQNSSLVEYNSTYINFSSVQGGVFYAIDSELQINKTLFQNIKAFDGGLIYVEKSSNITLDSIETQNSIALNDGGLIYAIGRDESSSCIIKLINFNYFNQSIAYQNGGCFHFNHSLLLFQNNQPILIDNSRALNTMFAIKGAFLLQQIQVFQMSNQITCTIVQLKGE